MIGIVLLVAFGLGMVWLARNTGMLRDGPDKNFPGSLARTQMAFWFGLTSVAYCYIWLLTGIGQDVVNSTTLALLGISAITGVGATSIDGQKDPSKRSFFFDILSEKPAGATAAGVTIHRVVMATWTIILGGVFLSTVLYTQCFPNFDATLLTLTGLTSGLYVGFKWLNS